MLVVACAASAVLSSLPHSISLNQLHRIGTAQQHLPAITQNCVQTSAPQQCMRRGAAAHSASVWWSGGAALTQRESESTERPFGGRKIVLTYLQNKYHELYTETQMEHGTSVPVRRPSPYSVDLTDLSPDEIRCEWWLLLCFCCCCAHTRTCSSVSPAP